MSMKQKFTNIARLDADQAREHLEKLRWPNGVVCVKCGSTTVYSLKPKADSKHPVRKGVYKCKDCRKQFTVTVGTLFEGSHIPLNKWLMAVSLMCSSKKGISANQLHRMLDVTYKTAWFMAHRIRYAMQQPKSGRLTGIFEVDETYIGGKPRHDVKWRNRKNINGRAGKAGRGTKKIPVVALVQRGGIVRSQVVKRVTSENLKKVIREGVSADDTIVMTDDFKSYKWVGKEYPHQVIRHSFGEYVRGKTHTNTVEGYFSLLKRGITGVFHHVSKKHLHRYLTEFDFRYNMRNTGDSGITAFTLGNIEGKRMTYRA